MFKISFTALLATIAAAKDGSDFNGDSYISLSRQEKSDKIWAKITESTKLGGWYLKGALIVDQAPVFDTPGDELECYWNGCRNKTIHAVGTVAKIQWKNLGGHGYTGMFKGADTGYARMTSAKPVDKKTPNIAPGMGVKLLRDGYDSANFVSAYAIDGQEDLNFFANDLKNHIPAPVSSALKVIEARFATQTSWIQTVGLSEMASYQQDGTQDDPVFPFILRFSPATGTNFASTVADGYVDFMQDLQSLQSGTTLYDVYALDKPEELGGTEKKIAQVVMTSEMTASNWGDEHFYIRHQRMDDDLALRPEWEPYTPKYEGLFNGLEQVENESDCPFAHLVQYLQ